MSTPSERLATAAHLHVLLRRKTGRVTDTEWLAVNAEYAAEIIRFAREHAAKDGHADLGEWATRMEIAMARATPAARRPLVEQAGQMVRERLSTPPPPVVPPAAEASRRSQDPAEAGRRSQDPAEPGRRSRDPAEAGDSTLGRRSDFAQTGFAESTFGGDPDAPRRDPNRPRYVGGIR